MVSDLTAYKTFVQIFQGAIVQLRQTNDVGHENCARHVVFVKQTAVGEEGRVKTEYNNSVIQSPYKNSTLYCWGHAGIYDKLYRPYIITEERTPRIMDAGVTTTSSILAQIEITYVRSLRETCLRTSMLSEWPVESTMPMAVEWFMPWQATPLMPSRTSFSRSPASYALLRFRIYNHVVRILVGALFSVGYILVCKHHF